MTKKKIKGVIFDLWGTILETGIFPTPIRQTKKILGLFKMSYPEFVVRFERVFMTNKYKNIKEGLDMVFKEFDVNPNEYDRVERLTGLWNKAKIQSKLYDDTIDTLKELKKDYKLFLLSNLPCTEKDLIDRYKFNDYFDDIFLSFELGVIKSDVDGYQKVLKKTRLNPDDVVMVGDSIESDIISSKKAGIKSILIDRRDCREHKFKVLALKEIPNMLKEVEKDG